MSKEKPDFDRIAAAMIARHADVHPGRLMSSPGLTCHGKVFAFQYKDGMGFRLGPTVTQKDVGVPTAIPLNPFKTKPPLKGWFVVPEADCAAWPGLADRALDFTRTLRP